MSKVHKVKNYREFVGELKEKAPHEILITGARHLPGGATVAMGGYGEFVHSLLYTVKFSKKDRDYREELFRAKRQGQRAWRPEDGASIATSTGLVTLASEIRLEMLQGALPNTNIAIIDPNTDKPVEPDVQTQAHENAINAGATPEASKVFL